MGLSIHTHTHTHTRKHLIKGGFPADAVVKNLPANAGAADDWASIPGSGRSPGGGNGNPLQYSCMGNPKDRGACRLQSMGSQGVRHN